MPLVLGVSRFAAGAVVILLAGACQAWQSDQRPVPEVVQEQRNGKIALTMNNVGWIVVRNPSLEGDSIVGTRTGGTVVQNSRTAVPVTAVSNVKTRQFSFGRTVGLGVAIALGALLAFFEPE
ncbi:MAG TPA: hypothetical protein VES88_01590 [Gemmatimonadaceae bacterium]|nr:hypothetical protein [Gemmatimonadaceae bacterium]